MGEPTRDVERMHNDEHTIETMIGIYCKGNHKGIGKTPGKLASCELCPDCSELRDYAFARIEHCPLGEKKTTCGGCKIHCYKPAMREKIQTVMRYSGPRIAFVHPGSLLRHIRDGKAR